MSKVVVNGICYAKTEKLEMFIVTCFLFSVMTQIMTNLIIF